MPKFRAFPKNESNTTYGECTAEDFNTLGYEIQNTIESANITTSLNENNQLSKAIANYVSIGALYDDITTDYSHINLSIKAPFAAPTQYFDGMVVSFLPQGNNLENATINVNGLGEIQIRAKLDEEGILANKIVLNEYIQLVYNSQINSFVIFGTSNNDDKGGQDVAGRYLLEPVWSPRILQETSYLRSDTFNWYDGLEHKQAYFHLLADIQNKTPTTETVEGITINCILADDGDKIILATDTETLTNLENLYNNTGIAWYYVLDTENTRFKLPRTQWNFVGVRPNGSAGEYVEESLPNIKGTFVADPSDGKASGAFTQVTNRENGRSGNDNYAKKVDFNASRSSSTYKDGASVQQRATQMILYFYVGGEEEVEPEEIVIRNRNIGEIFTTIFPVNDNGVIRLFGQEIDVSVDTYKSFYQVLKQLKNQETCPNLFCTEEEWQEFYTQHSFCPKFVVNEESNTVRMPLLKGYCKNVSSLEELGKINEAGLPNIKGAMTPDGVFSGLRACTPSGAFGKLNGSHGLYGENQNNAMGFDFDASRSSSVYKDGLNTVELDGYNALVYLVVANSTEETVSVIEDYEINNTVPLTCPVYAPNMFEDSNYLLSDNQYHSGDVYEAVWNLLTTQYNEESSVEITKTLSDGTSLTLKKTPLDYLICKIDENNTEEKINRFYNEIKFTCWVIDEDGIQFKLPQNTQRTLVESYKDENGNWYNLYNDGWLEQSGLTEPIANNTSINLFINYINNNYDLQITTIDNATDRMQWVGTKSEDSFTVTLTGGAGTRICNWMAKGYANTSALNNHFNFSNYLYFKVGNTTVGAELVYANKVLTELDKKANISGDNITFSNLSDTAKKNIQKRLSPDYNSPIAISTGAGQTYECEYYGTIIGEIRGKDMGAMIIKKSNSSGVILGSCCVGDWGGYNGHNFPTSFNFRVYPGLVLYIDRRERTNTLTFYPDQL